MSVNTSQYLSISQEVDKAGATLVAVSKTKSPDEIITVYRQGQRIFGENRAQELAEKYPHLPDDIQWHMIGHLQSNKVKYIAPFVRMIESVDSFKLLRMIEKEGSKNNRTIDVLLQIKIAVEPSKYGFEPDPLESELRQNHPAQLRHVRVRGVMGMASFIDDTAQIRREFISLKSLFEKLKVTCFPNDPHFDIISMGMSGDYRIALEEGSTMVRIGSLIFGPRE